MFFIFTICTYQLSLTVLVFHGASIIRTAARLVSLPFRSRQSVGSSTVATGASPAPSPSPTAASPISAATAAAALPFSAVHVSSASALISPISDVQIHSAPATRQVHAQARRPLKRQRVDSDLASRAHPMASGVRTAQQSVRPKSVLVAKPLTHGHSARPPASSDAAASGDEALDEADAVHFGFTGAAGVAAPPRSGNSTVGVQPSAADSVFHISPFVPPLSSPAPSPTSPLSSGTSTVSSVPANHSHLRSASYPYSAATSHSQQASGDGAADMVLTALQPASSQVAPPSGFHSWLSIFRSRHSGGSTGSAGVDHAHATVMNTAPILDSSNSSHARKKRHKHKHSNSALLVSAQP